MRKITISYLLLIWSFLNLSGNATEDSVAVSVPKHLTLEIISGDNQPGRVNNPLKDSLIIRVVNSEGNPEVNIPIEFHGINSSSHNLILHSPEQNTNSLGFASITVTCGKEPGNYEVMAACNAEVICTPVIFRIITRKSNWIFLLIIGLLGGLSLFFLGMSMMSEGLQNSAGNRMRNILGRLTNNRIVALGVGALITMIIQSSSATNVMLVSFVNSKLMRFRQTIGIMLGAAIGSTITAQIIAFKLTDYALIFVSFGLVIELFTKKSHYKEAGKAILGFGLLFYGMYIMSESMYPLRTVDSFIQVILTFENPALGILAGALLTAVIQSSSAFIGILIILSMQGLLSLEASIPLLIGANVGTSITAILASFGASRESKQVALAHTLYKVFGALVAVFLIPEFIMLVNYISASPVSDEIMLPYHLAQPRQIANAHTIYNILLCAVFFPIINSFASFVSWIFPAHEIIDQPFKLRYIDNGLIKTPSLALNSAREELVRMMKKVYHMTEKIILPFQNKELSAIELIKKSEPEINFLRDQIVDYLIRVTQNNVAPESAEEGYIIMNAVKEFEQIADTISSQLVDKAKNWCNHDYHFSESGLSELIRYHTLTLEILIKAIKVYDNFDFKKAKSLKESYKSYRNQYFELERQHYDRLRENIEGTVSSSKTHLEIITLLRVISSHATNTSRIILYRTNHNKNKRKNDPGKPSD